MKRLLLLPLFCSVLIYQASAFEISAYYDPVSYVHLLGRDTNSTPANEADVLNWWQDLGITTLCVYYTPDDYAHMNGMNFKVMNMISPGGTFKYLGAMKRRTLVATPDAYGWYDWTWAGHSRPEVDISGSLRGQVLMAQPSDSGCSPDTVCPFFQPGPFGQWNGWSWCENWDEPMRMHFKLTHKIERDTTDQADTVAVLYWFQQKFFKRNDSTFSEYVRFPGIPIKTSDQDTSRFFYETDYSIYPDNEQGTYCYTTPRPYFKGYDIDSTTTTPGTTGFAFPYTQTGAGTGAGMFQIDYTGHHTYYLYSVEAWDEGYHRLFRQSPDSIAYYRNQIVSAFSTEYNTHSNHLRSWYIDEPDKPNHYSYLAVQRLLNQNGMPGFITNGLGGNKWGTGTMDSLFYIADTMQVDVPVQMCEFDWEGGNSTWNPRGKWGSPVFWMWTDPSSDSPYINITGTQNSPDYWIAGGGCNTDTGSQLRYQGTKSIQAALDFSIWDIDPLWDLSGADWFPYCQHGYDFRHSLTAQVAAAHAHNTKLWALVAGGENGPNNLEYSCPIRTPSPNEIKLTAWLAVACDVDGIMWYNGLSAPRSSPQQVETWLGLLEWGTSASDNATEIFGDYNPASWYAFRTPRYYAAKKACTDIQKIAPILESLDFVRTYASRAFEENYHGSGNDDPGTNKWTKTDFLNLPNGSFVGSIASNRSLGRPDIGGWETPYVQVSRFKSPNIAAGAEDYWFLIVNRRVLPTETRQIFLTINQVNRDGDNYIADYILSGRTEIVPHAGLGFSDKEMKVILGPGEAELVHFYKQDTTDIVITTPTVITAPSIWTRNIVVRGGGSLTIAPATSRMGTVDSVAAVTFSAGKGIKFIGDCGSMSNKLSILGNDSVKIRLQSSFPTPTTLPNIQQWGGIACSVSEGDSIILRNAEITGAMIGLQITSKSGGSSLLSRCVFTENTTGLVADRNVILNTYNCRLTGNWEGLLVQNGAHLTLTDCEIDSNSNRGLRILSGSTVNLDNVMIHHNGLIGADTTLSSVLAENSDLRMKCSRIYENKGVGLQVNGGSLIMADNPELGQTMQWGGNQIGFNAGMELIISNLTGGFAFANGHNQVFDSPQINGTKGRWISCPGDTGILLDYRGNEWGGADSSVIANHIKPYAVFMPVYTGTQLCDLYNNPGGTSDCYVTAVKEEVNAQYALARANYKDIIKDTTDCGKKAALNRLTSVDFLGGFDNDSTRDYLWAIADTMTDDELKHAANMSIAFTLIKSEEYDSAKAMYQTILANASDSLDRVIDGMSGLLLLDMAKRMADTNRVGLTAEELTTYMKGLDHILKGDFTWTNYSITDSVVMYAPCRVDNAIWIQQNGALTILPLPGMDDPVVSFGPAGRITVDGKWLPYPPVGKLYVRGTVEQPVTLEWADSTTSTNIYNMGYMDLKHAVLRGKGFVNDNERVLSAPVIIADSCSFLSFDEGLWLGGTDSCSYLKNCLIEGVGRPEYINYYGSSILIYDNQGPLTIENCDIRNSGDVGIFSCYNWAGVNIKNTCITGSKNYGILTMEFADMRLECNQLSNNGDSIPEMWVDGGLVDLVGSRNEFTDSTGSLIYSADPSYVDLEDGENSFSLLTQNGRYLQSADTSSVWNITMNAWSPTEPTDTSFYGYLYPNNPANWTVDSSLADFVACGMGEAMSVNVLTQGEASDNERGSGTMSVDEGGDLNLSTDIARPSKANDTKYSKASSTDKQAIASKKSVATKRAKQADAKKLHQEELTKWREVKELSKTGNKAMAMEAGLKFLNEHAGSELVPAALISLANLTRGDGRTMGISDNLMKKSKELPFKKDRTLAKRLAYRVKAEEGNPAEALAGLEEMMDNSDSPQDSIRALVDAMGVHFFNKKGTNLHPRHESVVNADIPALKHRMIELSQLLTNPDQIPSGRGALIPTKYMLYQNYPNPFNPTTEIKFDLPEAVKVELRVFNILGQEVTTLINDVRQAGAYRIFWDSKNSGGSSVASGVYVYQIKAGNFTSAKKMVLMR